MTHYDHYEVLLKGFLYEKLEFIRFLCDMHDEYLPQKEYMFFDNAKLDYSLKSVTDLRLKFSFKFVTPEGFDERLRAYCAAKHLDIKVWMKSDAFDEIYKVFEV